MNIPLLHPQHRARLAAACVVVATFVAGVLSPQAVHACACGCGVFETGTPSMFPSRPGGMMSLAYDFMDQHDNWSGTSSAPADVNEDKRIRTHFVTAGAQYVFGRTWAVGAEVPWWQRRFETTDESGDPVTSTNGALGDVRVHATFAGFSDDLATSVTAGLKLPTGRRFGGLSVAPLLELIGATRTRDSGEDSNPGESGYDRLLVAPGIDATLGGVRTTLALDVPVVERVNGNQLVAPVLAKVVVGHAF